MSAWLIYGANGYTGALIAREAVRRGLAPILAGRNAYAVEALGKELGLPARAFLLDDAAAVEAAIADVALVLNCAGPFSRTAAPMLAAALARGAHYLDITGEIDVFESAQRLDQQARAAGVVVCPGVGFDVVPTDCIALMLKESMPGATHLALAIDAPLDTSPGTAKTMLENLPAGGKIRRDGTIVRVPFGYGARTVDFGSGNARVVAIPWGDVSTAYYTTGIPNVVVYARISGAQGFGVRLAGLLRGVVGAPAVQRYLAGRIERTVHGPSEEARRTGRTRIWGEARDATGRVQRIRMQTAETYAFTVQSALGAVAHVLDGTAPAGATTPARLLGSSYVLDLPGTAITAAPA